MKKINLSINLPVETVLSIIDVNDKRVEVDMKEALKRFKGKSDETMQSMNTVVTAQYKDLDLKLFEKAYYDHCTFTIYNIDRKKIERTNELKFFNVRIEFSTGKVKTFTVPSYVKFYSSQRGIFIPVEYIKNRDILIDYTGNIAKIDDAALNESFKMTDFYNIATTYEVEESPELNEYSKILNECNFYLNGVLTNISYNNFQKKEE